MEFPSGGPNMARSATGIYPETATGQSVAVGLTRGQAAAVPYPRVASLLPSATEMLYAIGAGGHLVARSHECDWPAAAMRSDVTVLTASMTAGVPVDQIDAEVRRLLGLGQPLYTVDSGKLHAAQPDLILTQDLCRVCSIDTASVKRIAGEMSTAADKPVKILSLDAVTLEGVLDDIVNVARAVGCEAAGRATVTALRERLYSLGEYINMFADGPNVAFLEWTSPLFVAGHWTPQLIERAGGRHVLNATVPIAGSGAAAGPIGATERTCGKSVTVPAEVLVASKPEVLIICPCGLTLDQAWEATATLSTEAWWPQLPAVKAGRVAVVDGNAMFNRPGPRLIDAFAFLVGYLNDRPGLIPADFPWRPWRTP